MDPGQTVSRKILPQGVTTMNSIAVLWMLFYLTHSVEAIDDCLKAYEKGSYLSAVEICTTAAEHAKDKKKQIKARLTAADSLKHLSRTLLAKREYERVLLLDPHEQQASLGVAETSLRLADFDACKRAMKSIKEKSSKEFYRHKIANYRKLYRLARLLVKGKQWKRAEKVYERLVADSPESSAFLAGWADCHIYMENYQRAIDILHRQAGLAGDSSDSYFSIGKAFLSLGRLDDAKKFINGAVRDNPDLRSAMALRSYIKQLEGRLDEAANKMLISPAIDSLERLKKELDGPVSATEKFYDPRFPFLLKSAFTAPINSSLCVKYSRKKNPNALHVCREAVGVDPANADLLKALIEALLANMEFDEAMQHAKALVDANKSSQEYNKLYQKCMEAEKKSKSKDYYAILEVDKSASDSDIKKAHKRLSKKWHPDKHVTNPKPAEMKMRDLNRANEVLSDPEKRKIFDATGLDPDDPEAQQRGFGGSGGNQGFGGFDFGGFGGDGFDFVFRDAQGREWRQAGGQQQQQRKQRKQHYKRQEWRWDDL